MACPDCDLLQRVPSLPTGSEAHCPRCGRRLAAGNPYCPDRVLALTLATAIVFLIANVTPLMGLSALGHEVDTTILGGVLEMWLQGQQLTALLVAFCTLIAPGIYIGSMLAILLAARCTPVPAWAGALLQLARFNQTWAMVEVMMLGILVALIKIADLATVVPGMGMYAIGALIILVTAITVSFDPHELWARIRWADDRSTVVYQAAEPERTRV